MTTENLGLMQAITQKMGWNEQRQKVIAENIANADTPGYRPNDLVRADFKNLLEQSTSGLALSNGSSQVNMAATDSAHFDPSGSGLAGSARDAAEKAQRKTYEVAPAGNAVIMEEQLLKMNETVMDHRMMSNLYQRNIKMLKLALGNGDQ